MTQHEIDVLLEVAKSAGVLFIAAAAWIKSRKAIRHADKAIATCSFPKCGHVCPDVDHRPFQGKKEKDAA